MNIQIDPKQCHKQYLKLKNTDDLFEFFSIDGRGGKNDNSFYDDFPEIEIEAKNFIAEETKKKESNFTIKKLAQFITTKFFEKTNSEQEYPDELVRTETAIHNDLIKWGASYDPVSKKTYFEGHEREDVVQERTRLVDYFLNRKDNYYRVDESNPPKWVEPTENPTVTFFHDETTFKTGEQNSKRWYFNNSAPFISKGRGRSLMVSDFLMAHPSGPFFRLNEEEWKRAIKKYPSLLEEEECNYEPNSCTGSMIPGQEGYFDNESILLQFERLFQMLEFKKDFHFPVKHQFEIVVDNARTHTKLDININDFRLRPGGFCPCERLEWIDEND